MKFIGNRHLIDSVDIFSPINTQQNFSNVDGKTFDDIIKHFVKNENDKGNSDSKWHKENKKNQSNKFNSWKKKQKV